MNISKQSLSLQEAIELIAASHVFNVERYPELAKLNKEERLRFAINHNLLHMAKQIGKIATHLEDQDHGGVGNSELLKEAIVKQFINILRTAELVGMDEKDLFEEMQKFVH